MATALAVAILVAWVAVRPSFRSTGRAKEADRWVASWGEADGAADGLSVNNAAQRVDTLLETAWTANSIEPAGEAEPLQIFRRLALALVGTPPSLEEIRQFEADKSPRRLEEWTTRYIGDSRFIEYFAARLGDVFVDPVAEDLKPHQRERFRKWLGGELQRGRPYSEIVREMVAARGSFFDRPATTFVSLELSGDEEAAQRLAARTARAFLGQRIDCAQCHDHPFADWKQSQFESLAAYYGQVRFRSARVQDTRPRPFIIEDVLKQESRTVEPAVPFDSKWVPEQKHLRAELAVWLTHPKNRRFRRAIANRVWGLMLGRPFIAPVDDLPDPGSLDEPDVLDMLASDLSDNGDDLRRLIHVIVGTRAFRLASRHDDMEDELAVARLEAAWAVFPVTELCPQQMIRSMQQAAIVQTLRADGSNTFVAIRRYERRSRFVDQYGIAGDAEEAQASTIPHTVERLIGRETQQYSDAGMFTAAGRIAAMSSDPDSCLENCYLACLSRRPTADEASRFLPRMTGKLKRRVTAVEDVYWALFNSAEFCWNH